MVSKVPFYEKLIEDRVEIIQFLSEVLDLGAELERPFSSDYFRALFSLNNVALVRWLLDKYDPSLGAVFVYKNPWVPEEGDPAVDIALMERFGRAEMAQIFKERYGIVPAKKIPQERLASSMGLPPPSSTKFSRNSAMWRDISRILRSS